ncbi:MAG: phosphate signaling complex protein PhoU, partial [Nitrospinae bacterium]|nr:phosphate signaling complex protein PhoU [Nitrospinota bacterium]
MGKHLLRDLDNLKKELLLSGSMVEEAVNQSIDALVNRRMKLAKEVIEGDLQINRRENQIEEECLKLLALHQPVASDLRFIITVLKVNNDLERIGDLAVNVAERALYLSNNEALKVVLNFPRMAEGARVMVQKSLDALIEMDAKLARTVLTMDDEIDDLNREMFSKLQN